jgi:secondary thiamine-phosphate synthase enzyme
MQIINLSTKIKNELIDITTEIQRLISESNIQNGLCVIYCPHTTGAITINENADPDVKSDIIKSLNNIVKELDFKHSEGNSCAHVKSSMIGKSETIIIKNNKLQLGTWDGVYFCEFDGPRNRTVFIEILSKS